MKYDPVKYDSYRARIKKNPSVIKKKEKVTESVLDCSVYRSNPDIAEFLAAFNREDLDIWPTDKIPEKITEHEESEQEKQEISVVCIEPETCKNEKPFIFKLYKKVMAGFIKLKNKAKSAIEIMNRKLRKCWKK
jgi:hypothetical protein